MIRKKFKKRRQINLLTIFLVFDLFLVATFLKTSQASYVSEAVSTTEMDVALYAFHSSGMTFASDENDVFEDETSLDIQLGNIGPGETKYYKFRVYNTDKDGNVSDTNIAYVLKVITTTNIKLDYDLYLNQNASSTNAVSLIDSNELSNQLMTDSYGTYFRVFTVPELCFLYGEEKFDEYTLKVTFPKDYSSSEYQDLVESIKIQMRSKQVLADDYISVCR